MRSSFYACYKSNEHQYQQCTKCRNLSYFLIELTTEFMNILLLVYADAKQIRENNIPHEYISFIR